MFVGSGSVNLKSAPDPTMARCFVSPSGTDILPGASQVTLCFMRRSICRVQALSGIQGTLRNRCDQAA